jgi:hypothetical protein
MSRLLRFGICCLMLFFVGFVGSVDNAASLKGIEMRSDLMAALWESSITSTTTITTGMITSTVPSASAGVFNQASAASTTSARDSDNDDVSIACIDAGFDRRLTLKPVRRRR